MAQLEKARPIKWAGVEFQPNLLKPVKPIRLGLVMVQTEPRLISIQVIGRMPKLDSRPPEFKGVSDITMKIASGWVNHLFKDIAEIKEGDIFDALAERWKWNLYMISPGAVQSSDIRDIFKKTGEAVYEKFVGEPFEEKAVKPIGKPTLRVRDHIPPAWLLKEVMSQERLAA